MDEQALEQMPPIDNIGLIRVRYNGNLVGIIPNIDGKRKSLRLFNGLASREKQPTMDRNAIGKALQIYGPALRKQTKADPKKHPTIELLMKTKEGDALQIERVRIKKAGLFDRLLSDSATSRDKLEGMELLEAGQIRTAEPVGGVWQVQLYAVAAMNAVFSMQPNKRMGPRGLGWYDKVDLQNTYLTAAEFKKRIVRFMPYNFSRRGAYIGPGTALMPMTIVNTGSYISGGGAMIDGAARVSTGAQVGNRVKLGAGSGLEGMLEPKGLLPTIIEDGVTVGAECELKGIIGKGSIVGSGTIMASGIRIYDDRTEDFVAPYEMTVGEKTYVLPYIPPDRVAVTGVYIAKRNLTRRCKSGYVIGGICVRLLEPPASKTDLARVEKNSALYGLLL